jgi:hypothetical protein
MSSTAGAATQNKTAATSRPIPRSRVLPVFFEPRSPSISSILFS